MTNKIGLWAIGALCGLASAAGAQVRPEAEALFRDGKLLMQQGKIAEACEAFEASETAEHSVATVLSLADCRDRNHQYASAWALFLQADSQTRTDASRAGLNRTAKARAAALEPKLSYLTVSVSDESRIEGLTLTRNGKPFEPMLWNHTLPVDGGDYIIAGRAPGHEAWQTTVQVPAEAARISVEVPKFKELGRLISPRPPDKEGPRAPRPPVVPEARLPGQQVPQETPARPLPVAPPPAPRAPRAPPTTSPAGTPRPATPALDRSDTLDADATTLPAPGFTTRRKLALGIASGGVISAIAGVAFGFSARANEEDAYKLCPRTVKSCADAGRANALLETAHTRALEANVAFGVGAALAVGAGVLWFTGGADAEHPRRITVIPSVAPDQAGLVITGRL